MYVSAEKPLKSVMVLGSMSSPISPSSSGPGANTWMKGAPGNGTNPPGIGFGSEPAATAGLADSTRPADRTTVATDATTGANRSLIGTPPPPKGPDGPERSNSSSAGDGCQAISGLI